MTAFDITLALTAHSETVIAGPTMRSAEAAIRAAEAEGLSIERLIGFDTCTEECRTYFSSPAFARWEVAEFGFRDQGRTRNALARVAKGRWLAFLDGDDLFSENWLVEAARLLETARKAGKRIIVHPELNWGFDADQFVLTKPAQDDPLFTPYYFSITNYYDALCVAPCEVWLDHPYAHRAIPDGFAYEDWQWGIETMAAGWHHVVAENTVIFKRRRDSSQTHQSSNRMACIRAVEAMAIDRVLTLGCVHQKGDECILDSASKEDNNAENDKGEVVQTTTTWRCGNERL
jgi:hypothetical protein